MIVWSYGVPTVGFGTLTGEIVSVVQVPAGPAVTLIDSRSLPTKVATMGDAEESVMVMIWRLLPLASLQLIAPVSVPARRQCQVVRNVDRCDKCERIRCGAAGNCDRVAVRNTALR